MKDEIDVITKVQDAAQAMGGKDAYRVIVTAAERDTIVRALRDAAHKHAGPDAELPGVSQ